MSSRTIQGKDSQSVLAYADALSGGIVVTGLEDRRLGQGNAFTASGVYTLGAFATLVVTGMLNGPSVALPDAVDDDLIPQLMVRFSCRQNNTTGFLVQLYDNINSFLSTPSTVTSRNRNRSAGDVRPTQVKAPIAVDPDSGNNTIHVISTSVAAAGGTLLLTEVGPLSYKSDWWLFTGARTGFQWRVTNLEAGSVSGTWSVDYCFVWEGTSNR